MTYTALVRRVVDYFVEAILEEGFESFGEMSRCYGWDSKDIKEEIVCVINDTQKAYADDCGDITIYDDGSDEPYAYRPFITAIRKQLKTLGF